MTTTADTTTDLRRQVLDALRARPAALPSEVLDRAAPRGSGLDRSLNVLDELHACEAAGLIRLSRGASGVPRFSLLPAGLAMVEERIRA